ncbi:MAG: hypothetical protein J3Q66DRAFT_423982 [Benniella sp.]|nr:MAG: hypothetical protein J3Q66DRAFT_423982 [Benniella sp.]
MKIALTCLAAVILPSVALAQHYACMRVFEPMSKMVHVAIFDHNKNIIMDETKTFTLVKHYTFKSSRGRFDWSGDNTWSAAFDGEDWGNYHWQNEWSTISSDYKIGCYDKTGSAYCLEPSLTEMYNKCKDKIDD